MYISIVHIENFRNFSKIDIPLKPFTIIVGKNDTGKSNFVDAINILLYNSKGNYYAKSLSKYDFNILRVNEFITKMKAFYEGVKDNFNAENYAEELIKNAPIVIIRLKFEDVKNTYEQSLLRDWLNGDEKLQFFEIEYKYYVIKDGEGSTYILDEIFFVEEEPARVAALAGSSNNFLLNWTNRQRILRCCQSVDRRRRKVVP